MKRILLYAVLLAALAGCGRNRFDSIDIAASEKTFSVLREGFSSVPDSIPEGRTAFLLSQGVPVADVLVFGGEVGDSLRPCPPIPYGYACESVSSAELMDSLHVVSQRLYTDGGLNARMLYLADPRMSVAAVNKVAELADKGAFIGGVKPVECLSGDVSVSQRTVEKVWLSGNVMSGKTVQSILKAAGVKPDVDTKVDSLVFQHRHLPDAEIYHITNQGSHSGKIRVGFRVRGRLPLQWNPDTGEISTVGYKLKKSRTNVTFYTVPGDDTFIVFASFAEKRKLKAD